MSDEIKRLADAGLVARIRTICAREYSLPVDYDFFYLSYEYGESADDALLRLFNEENESQPHASIEQIALTLCHG